LLYEKVKGIIGSKVITEKREIESRVIINAAGPWAPQISAMHSKESKVVELMPTIGVMLVFEKRLNSMVLNRLRPPSDGDIIVPYYETSILGTTAQVVEDPDNVQVENEDIQYLIEEGSAMVPKLSELKPKRYYYSVRPLLKGSDARSATRDFEIYDEGDMLTIVGGKLTTSRLMAEKLSDVASEKLGVKSKSTTSTTPIPDALSMYALRNTIGDELYSNGYAFSKLEEALQND
jgi:glycerol-3-phosphate dehydrogenase